MSYPTRRIVQTLLLSITTYFDQFLWISITLRILKKMRDFECIHSIYVYIHRHNGSSLSLSLSTMAAPKDEEIHRFMHENRCYPIFKLWSLVRPPSPAPPPTLSYTHSQQSVSSIVVMFTIDCVMNWYISSGIRMKYNVDKQSTNRYIVEFDLCNSSDSKYLFFCLNLTTNTTAVGIGRNGAQGTKLEGSCRIKNNF